jgi:DNA (cytosine-5)-methyltransferase 1
VTQIYCGSKFICCNDDKFLQESKIMATVINRNLGMNRGSPRIFLDGAKILNESINAGDRYDCEYTENSVRLVFCETGQKVVTPRHKNQKTFPVIDINNKKLGEIFEEGETLRIAIKDRVIVIKSHVQRSKIEERNDSVIKKLNNNEPLLVASLCHGGGVLDRSVHTGLERVGIKSKIAMAVEIESAYLDSSLRNNPMLWDENSVVIESPIELVNFNEKSTECSLLIAGIPCLGASRSGKTKGKLQFAESHNSAGAIFFYVLQAIQCLNPAICLIENVVEYSSTASMSVIRLVLDKLGYDLHERVVTGTDFGALEARSRMAFIAISKGLDMHFDIDELLPTDGKYKTLADIIDPSIGLDDERWKTYDYLANKAIKDKEAGKGFARQFVNPEDSKVGVIGRGYFKARSTEPFLLHPFDPLLSRLFTPEEHAKIKGVPLELIANNSATISHEILGQGITFGCFVELAAHLGASLSQLKCSKTIKMAA